MRSIKLCNLFACVVLAAAMSSCEKLQPTETSGAGGEGRPNVVLRVRQFETVPFESRSRSAVGDVCTKLCFDIYDEDGLKVTYKNQKLETEGFGEASFTLDEGDYYLVVLGHSAATNPSFATKEMKITASGSLTDMFWACEPLHVAGEDITKELTLKRIVSMVRFIPNDEIPDEANELLVQYKGSKGTFSGLTGYGTTTTTQKLTVELEPTDEQMDFYVVPRKEKDTLTNVNVIARYNDGSAAKNFSEKTIDSIPVRRNCITVCRGNLFDNESSSHTSFFTIVVDDKWGESIGMAF